MKKLYAIYDKKAKHIVNGFAQLQSNDTVAIRMFSEVAQLPGSTVAKYPEDFDLVSMAALDDNDIIIAAIQETIMTGTDLIAALTAQENAKNAR